MVGESTRDSAAPDIRPAFRSGPWLWNFAYLTSTAVVLLTAGGTLDGGFSLLAVLVLMGGISGGTWTSWTGRAACIGGSAALLCWEAGVGGWGRVQAAALLLSVALAVGWMDAGARPGRQVGLVDGLIAVGALVWLTLPLWVPWQAMGARAVPWIVELHPLFAMNAALLPLGVWTEQPLPYRWIRLGQDVPYTLPGSVWPAIALELAIATVGQLGCRWLRLIGTRR